MWVGCAVVLFCFVCLLCLCFGWWLMVTIDLSELWFADGWVVCWCICVICLLVMFWVYLSYCFLLLVIVLITIARCDLYLLIGYFVFDFVSFGDYLFSALDLIVLICVLIFWFVVLLVVLFCCCFCFGLGFTVYCGVVSLVVKLCLVWCYCLFVL